MEHNNEVYMKKLMLFLAALFIPVCMVSADEHVESGNKYLTSARMLVDYFDPSIDEVYFMKNGRVTDGEWATGLSASLYTFDSRNLDLLSIRLGYIPENEHRYYSGADLDIKNAYKRYASDSFKDRFTPEFSEKFWEAIDRYTTIGFMFGYDLEHRDTIWGPKFAIRMKW